MAQLGTALAWLAPLLVAIELVGTAVAQSIATTIALLVLFLGAAWLPIAPDPGAEPISDRRALWIRRGAGALLVLVFGAVLGFGIARIVQPARFPPASLPAWLREHEWFVLLPVIACWPVALGVPWLLGKRLRGGDFERAGLLVALVFLALLQAKLRVQGLFVLPYGKAWLAPLLTTVTVVVALLVVVPPLRRIPPIARLALLVLAAVVLRAAGLETWKLDPATRDMLPLVVSAQDTFIAGHNPYDLHQMQRGSVVPLTYLPGMWMLHGIPRLVGLDLRWTGIIADAVVAGMLWWAASGVAAEYRERARGLALGFGAAWMFSPSVHWNGLYAEPHAWWLVLAVVIAATVRRRWWLAAGALGVALATRHFALIVAPFVVVAMWRSLGWRAALPRVGLSGAIAAALLLPFALRDPETFWFGTYRWLVEYGPAHQSWFWFKFGFSGPLYEANAVAWMPRAQAAIVLLMLALAVFVRGRRAYLGPAATAYVGFIMFNGIIWDSFYLGAALFPAFAAAAGHDVLVREPAHVDKRVFLAGAVATALSLVAGGVLLVSLARSLSVGGKGELRNTLAREVKRGDALIDRNDWELAFVRGKPVFGALPPPTHAVGRHPFDRAFGIGSAFETPRLWLVTRGARDAELHAQLRALGTPSEQHIGRYRLSSIAPPPLRARLSALTAQLSPSFNGQALEAARPGSWRSSSVTYVEAGPRPCRIGGTGRTMVYAHPAVGGELRLTFAGVDLGRALVIFGGIDDGVVLWGRADVDVAVSIDDQPSGELRLVNRPGVEWIALDTSRYADGVHEVELTLTTRDDTQRFTCIDGLVLGG